MANTPHATSTATFLCLHEADEVPGLGQQKDSKSKLKIVKDGQRTGREFLLLLYSAVYKLVKYCF